MHKNILVLSALLSCAMAAAGSGLIRDNDRDGDGKLSWEEIKPFGWSKETFELKDMDGDGKISEEDFYKHIEWLKKPALNEKILKAMDTNGDGVLQKGVDWWWWDEADFIRYDTNKDDILDKAELAKIPRANPQRSVGKAISRQKSARAP